MVRTPAFQVAADEFEVARDCGDTACVDRVDG